MRLFTIFFSCLAFVVLPSLIQPTGDGSAAVRSAKDYFAAESPAFAHSCTELRRAIGSISVSDPSSVVRAREKLVDCRLHYKRIESFLEYFFRSSSRIYNRPPKYEPEEPDMEYQSPAGLQVIESLLFEKTSRFDKKELLQQIGAVENSAADLPALLYGWQANDAQLLESLRIELIRVMALDITGYEAPLVKSGIAESYEAMVSLRHQLEPYLAAGETRSDSLRFFLGKAIGVLGNGRAAGGKPVEVLAGSRAFDAFDRLAFLTGYALPLQRQLSRFIREKKLELNTSGILNYDADNLFSPDALLPDHFSGGHAGMNGPPGDKAESPGEKEKMVALGKRLFSEKSLSGNGMKSCASCHSPEKMFTDQLPTSVAFDGHHSLDRNAPSLLYSAFQYKQFWDGRVSTLEDQISTVLQDPREMKADTTSFAYPMSVTVTALAAFVRSLHPMNSPFDRYMQGNAKALNDREKNGANLFMGKAQCATCHFMPLFNGLIPPDYAMTEFEVLGTTASDHFEVSTLSKDPGRYTVYAFPFYKGAFKTPTVRNTAFTYPYMHNGAFHSLEKVMEFYNKGGGAGLGLRVPDQTLSPEPLHLSSREIGDIILFIHALTDSLAAKP
jgi:cytochrome c peroxidase